MTKLGFKEITPTNWLEVDETIKRYVKLSPDGTVAPMTSDDWLQPFLQPRLINAVPTDVQSLFEVARGARAIALKTR